MKKALHYFYDKEADVFYFSQGIPRASDEIVEAGNDVLLRRDQKTKKVRGFTLLNASQQPLRKNRSIPVPFSLMSVSIR